MPPTLVVEVVGDASGLLRTFRRVATASSEFQRKTARDADSLNLRFKGLASTVAGYGAAFIGLQGAADAFKTVVNAGVEAQRSQRQLATQLRANSESFRQNKTAVEQAALSMGRFGFTVEQSEQALTILDRGTKNIRQAIRLQGLAADIARAKNIDLSQAALAVAKVFGGQETALRRLVPGLGKHVHGLVLIREAYARMAGQAAAGTTAEDKFRATLHNSEVIIGTALLPTVTKYLTHLSDWLEKMNRSGRLQRDVNQALKDATQVVQGLKDVLGPLVTAFRELSSAVGGTRHAVELLVGAFLVFKTARFLNSITGAATAVGEIGTQAEASTGKVEGLKRQLGLLSIPALALTDLTLGKQAFTQQATAGDVGGRRGDPFQRGSNLDAEYQQAFALAQAGLPLTPGLRRIQMGPRNFFDAQAITRGLAAGRRARAAILRATGRGVSAGVAAGLTGRARPAVTALTGYQQLQLGLAADPNSIALLQQQAAHDRAAIAFAARLRARGTINNAKYVQEVTAYENDLTSTLSTITSIQSTAASKAAAAARKAAEARKKASEFTVPLTLQVAEARAQALGGGAPLERVERVIRRAAERALKSGRLSLEAQVNAWNTIAQVNDALKKQNDQFVIKYRRTLRGTQPAYQSGGVVIHGGLHLHGIQDVNQLEYELEARAKRRPQPRRGR